MLKQDPESKAEQHSGRAHLLLEGDPADVAEMSTQRRGSFQDSPILSLVPRSWASFPLIATGSAQLH